ncbi:hypothetical protein ACLMJK_007324 [Lecanora helva]
MASQLDKPSQWATGNDAPTEKQKGFISTLAQSKGVENVNPNEMNKSEASVTINDLKNKDTANPDAAAGAPIQDPNSWSTGDDQATGKQTGYIAAMAREAGEKVPTEGMGKTDASKRIEELKEKTGM